MEELSLLVEALQSRAWYPVAGIGVALLLKVLTLRSDWLFARLPQGVQWLPAAVLMVGGAFVDAFQAGANWQVAIGLALYAALSGTPMAVGTHHIGKRVVPALKVKAKRVGKTTVALLLLLALPAGPVSCASLPAVGTALPAAFDSIAIGLQAVTTIRDWLDRVEGAPGLTPERHTAIIEFLDKSESTLRQAREAGTQGVKTAEEVQKLKDEGMAALQSALDALTALGLRKGGDLIEPTDGVARADVPAVTRVNLPPEVH